MRAANGTPHQLLYFAMYNVCMCVCVCMYQIIMLYTLNLYNIICQLYLSKAGEKQTMVSNGYLNNGYLIP